MKTKNFLSLGAVLLASLPSFRVFSDFEVSQGDVSEPTPEYTVMNPPVHQYLAEQGLLLNGVPQNVRDHVWNDIYAPLDFIFTAKYDSGDDIIVGSGEEDREKNPFLPSLEEIGCTYPFLVAIERICSNGGRNGFFEHFWNPDVLRAGVYYNGMTENGTYNRGLKVSLLLIADPRQGNYDSAFRLAEDYHANYVLPLILAGDTDEGYYWFGRELHLLEDSTVPAHVQGIPHGSVGSSDSYETFFENHPDKLFNQKGAAVWEKAYHVDSLPNMEGFNWSCVYSTTLADHEATDLFKLFWYTAQKTQYGATRTESRKQKGNGWYRCTDGSVHQFSPSLWSGEPISPPMDPSVLNDAGLDRMAQALIPHAFRAVAGLAIILEADLKRHHLSLWDSGNLPVGVWTSVQHNFSVPANLEIGRVQRNNGPAMTIREAVDQGLLKDQAWEFYNNDWRTFDIDLHEWRFLPNRKYSVKALKLGVKILLRAVEDYPRTTKFFKPLPNPLY